MEPVVGTVCAREGFSEEQKEIEQMVRSFGREQILPHREELETLNKEVTLQLMKEAADLGLCSIEGRY